MAGKAHEKNAEVVTKCLAALKARPKDIVTLKEIREAADVTDREADLAMKALKRRGYAKYEKIMYGARGWRITKDGLKA